ncbi:MAG: hypothetical protein JNL21_35090 [Myxococcales bacterium]|nr:hypothetical protein [Myxococcales bacterium]
MNWRSLATISVFLLASGCVSSPSRGSKGRSLFDSYPDYPARTTCRSMSVAESKAVEEAARPPHFAGSWPSNCAYPFLPGAARD